MMTYMLRHVIYLGLLASTWSFHAPCTRKSTFSGSVALNAFSTSGLWNAGLNYGKGPFKFYSGFNEWMKPFTDEDREAYPELFTIPKGLYEVKLARPLGIIFEEIEAGKGVYVQDLVEGGNAEYQGSVEPGDILVGITAVKIVGAKWERRLIPCRSFNFDTMLGAVGSNDVKWGCENVIMMFERPGEGDPEKIREFLDFFEPPSDSVWRQRQ